MAAYREHITVSGICGVGYGVTAWFAFGFTPVEAALAGTLTWIGGMLPDLDSDSGRPIRELFSLLAAIVPCVMLRRLMRWGGSPENTMFLAVCVYVGVRYIASAVLAKVSVHRGMFHSIPAMLIAAEMVFLGYESDRQIVRLLMAGGVALGFMSHLVLDEVYAVQWTGVRLKLNKAAGSAVKLFGTDLPANAVAYSLLFVLSYASLVEAGLVDDPTQKGVGRPVRQAIEKEEDVFRR